mmetsp:Transcript_28285/g.85242  ORF Transcript_28285/g.85242 Transcript_28285/m.85242 type:complete len:554 (+) Transcript_28285:1699-3360(+)
MLRQYVNAASICELSAQSRAFNVRIMPFCLCGALPLLLATSSISLSKSFCGKLAKRSEPKATNFRNKSSHTFWSTRSQSPTFIADQLASVVDANSIIVLGVSGMTAYSKKHAISNLHMSVNRGKSTEVAKSMSHTASSASIMMLAAFKSPCARPMSGYSSLVAFAAMPSRRGLIVLTTSCFRSGKSPPKCSLYSLRMAGSGGYSPFLAVNGLYLPSFPLSVYQPHSSGCCVVRRSPWPPFRSEETTPPGPKVSAKTLLTLPNGRTSPAAAAEPKKTCSPSYSSKSLKVDRRFAEPWASSGTFQHAPASSRRIAPKRWPEGSVAYLASPRMRAARSGSAWNTFSEFTNSSSMASALSSLTMQAAPFRPSASNGWTLITNEPLKPPAIFCASNVSNISSMIFLYASARSLPLKSLSHTSLTSSVLPALPFAPLASNVATLSHRQKRVTTPPLMSVSVVEKFLPPGKPIFANISLCTSAFWSEMMNEPWLCSTTHLQGNACEALVCWCGASGVGTGIISTSTHRFRSRPSMMPPSRKWSTAICTEVSFKFMRTPGR